ncbi:hypothetical protein AVEN_61082-1 [Araneus ventricosus]|uniref:Uncharacterized protein n=1 Tax=Araneus ventricosus TaxID=182803 RepID=A0A4Y2PWX1_ARAVE|nr:hypothetical protein AVEN_61082-1 [Araneus ventricosus]
MLFQNDIPIDVACHRYTLNMQVSSGTKNNSSPNGPSCTTVTVSFNGVLLVVTGTWRSPYESPARIGCKLKPRLSRKAHQPLLRYQYRSLLRLIAGDVSCGSGTSDMLRAYRRICS